MYVVGKMRKTVAALVCMTVFTCLVFQSSVSADATWDIEIVSEEASFIGSGYCPIKVDSEGNPHIVYRGSGHMGYVSWNGSEWINQKGSYPAPHDLVLDANDTPHITVDSLGYATWNGTQWNIQPIDTGYIPYSSLALDSSGNAHIAYINGDKLRYATQNGSNWSTQTVDTDANLPDIEPTFSLALDSNETPHIMYYSRSSFVDEKGLTIRSMDLKLAVLQNSSWTIEHVPTSLNLVAFGNMVLDSAGHPHFIVKQQFYPEGSDTRRFTVDYFRWDGSAWKTQTVTSNVSLTQLGVLALDSEDRPHIIYVTEYRQQLMYARWTGTEWETHHVDKYWLEPSHGFDFVLDSNGNPHISYIKVPEKSSYTSWHLMYATTTLPLDVSIVSPENKTYSTNEVPLKFTTSKPASSTYYSLDGEANVTLTGNTTLTNLPNGTHNLTIYAEDNNGNTEASETIYFTITKEANSTLLLISAAAITAAAIIILVYVWKKKQ
jgi:hypothetical protein